MYENMDQHMKTTTVPYDIFSQIMKLMLEVKELKKQGRLSQ
jgi:hypothetical protein